MNGLSRTAVVALAVAFGLAYLGATLIQRSGGIGDFLGLLCVTAGVMTAALTNTERA